MIDMERLREKLREEEDARVTKDIGNLVEIESHGFVTYYVRERDIVPASEAILCSCNCGGTVCGVDDDCNGDCDSCAHYDYDCPYDDNGDYICTCECHCDSNSIMLESNSGDTIYAKKIFRYGSSEKYLSESNGWCQSVEGGTACNLSKPLYVGTIVKSYGDSDYERDSDRIYF